MCGTYILTSPGASRWGCVWGVGWPKLPLYALYSNSGPSSVASLVFIAVVEYKHNDFPTKHTKII